jgi:membrane peptidoglycan carboxypeptidase
VYLGNGYWGIDAAAHGYFHRRPGHLSIAQAALLAGLPQAPSALDPLVHRAAARRREWAVLQNLVAVHALTLSFARRVYRMPLHLYQGAGASR